MQVNGRTTIKFDRQVGGDFTASDAVPMLAAYSQDSDELAYHGSTRQAFELNLTGA